MNKIIKILFFVLFAVLLGLVLMFSFKICPPIGPWPMPPWCSAKAYKAVFYDIEVDAKHLDQVKAVSMADTWGANYNFNMVENTRDNISSSFERIKGMGGEEVYVNDFHRAVYGEKEDFKSLDYKIVDEVFGNDFRDESMTKKDLENLAKEAHTRGLKVGIKHNMAFVNIGKYILSGLSGKIEGDVNKDYNEFNSSHTEEWTRDFFKKWKERMLERGRLYKEAGIDIMSITPTWMGPTFKGNEKLVNELWKDLISSLRQEFKGDIHTMISIYGFLEGIDGGEDFSLYDYYKDTDVVEIDVYRLTGGSLDVSSYISLINQKARAGNVKVSIFFSPFSYKDSMDKGIVEFLDPNNAKTKATEKDWQYQADIWQELFESMEGKDSIGRIMVAGYWWDDAMDPLIKPKVSITPSVRNKPAEAVIKAWFSK